MCVCVCVCACACVVLLKKNYIFTLREVRGNLAPDPRGHSLLQFFQLLKWAWCFAHWRTFLQLENQSELCRRVLLLRRHLSLPEPEKSDKKTDKKIDTNRDEIDACSWTLHRLLLCWLRWFCVIHIWWLRMNQPGLIWLSRSLGIPVKKCID